MTDINFQPLFEYIDGKIDSLKEDQPSKADIVKLQNSVDTLANRFDRIEQGSVVLNSKVKHVEDWVIQAAEENKVPYQP